MDIRKDVDYVEQLTNQFTDHFSSDIIEEHISHPEITFKCLHFVCLLLFESAY